MKQQQKQREQQIFIRSPLTKTWQQVSCDLNRDTNPNSQAESLSAYVHDTWGLQPADFFLVYRNTTTKNPVDSETEQSADTNHSNTDALFIELHITGLGGKGGFGSLLRGQTARAGQKKSNNTDACRDLNGRRLWQARAEKELAEWYQKQRTQEAQNSTSASVTSSSRKRTEPANPANTTDEGEGEGDGQFFDASQFREARDSTVSLIASSVQAAIKSGRAKQKKHPNEPAPSKKRARLIGDVLPDLPAENVCPTESSDESSDQSDAHSTSTTKTSSTLATLDSSTTILTSATNRTRFTSASVATSGATNHSSITHGATFTHPSSITTSTIATTTTMATQQKSLPTDTTSRTVPQGAIAALAPSTVSLDSSATLVTEKEEANDQESTIVQVSSLVEQQPQSSSQLEPQSQSESQSQSQSQPQSFAPINLAEYSSADELIAFGAEHLKWELQRLGLKCGGTCVERAQRLWLLKSCPIEKLDAKYFAKKPAHK